MKRRDYKASCRALEELGYIEKGSAPSEPLARRPLHDDEELGVEFFRTLVEDDDLSNMTLPRTFFGRSTITRTSFANTDLRESTLCWNDFVDVDFSDACLAESDLRASLFERVNFRDANLRGTDMRLSSFVDCTFVGTDMTGAKLTTGQIHSWALSEKQRNTIDWQDDEGEEPGGG